MNVMRIRPLRQLLGLPLFYKLLIANALLVFLVAIASSAAVQRQLSADATASPWSAIIAIALVALLVTVVVNGVVVKLALQPLSRLTDAVRRVEQGDYTVRAEDSPVADRDLRQLTHTFNDMLDSVASYRQRLRAVAVRDLNTHEAERKRLSNDLHDGTAQSLAALLFQIKAARGTEDAQERGELLGAVSAELARAIEGLRGIAQDLRPQALDMLGISPALERYARTMSERTGFPIDVRVARLEGVLSPAVELALYRLVQEAVLNVIQHANAKTASLSVERAGNRVIARVTDDGCGFDPDAVIRDVRNVGLFAMHERSAELGGMMTVQSRRGEGTTVTIDFPVASAVRYA